MDPAARTITLWVRGPSPDRLLVAVAAHEVAHTIGYQITDGPSPVSKEEVQDYYGTIRLIPVTDTNETLVEWSSRWEGTDSACAFCSNIYVTLLNVLKNKLARG